MAVGLEPDGDDGGGQQRAGEQQRAAAHQQVERSLAPRAEVGRVVHRVPSGVSQPTSLPWRSQSNRPAASAAVVST